jgi:hypothetical protein
LEEPIDGCVFANAVNRYLYPVVVCYQEKLRVVDVYEVSLGYPHATQNASIVQTDYVEIVGQKNTPKHMFIQTLREGLKSELHAVEKEILL